MFKKKNTIPVITKMLEHVEIKNSYSLRLSKSSVIVKYTNTTLYVRNNSLQILTTLWLKI